MRHAQGANCRHPESKYGVTDLASATRCLGINVHKVTGGYHLEQENFIEELLVKYGLEDSKPAPTPLATDHGYFEDAEAPSMIETEMRSAIGVLLWLAGSTRPDITRAMNLTSKFNTRANENHVRGIKRIMRYLRGTSSLGLNLVPNASKTIQAEVFADAD